LPPQPRTDLPALDQSASASKPLEGVPSAWRKFVETAALKLNGGLPYDVPKYGPPLLAERRDVISSPVLSKPASKLEHLIMIFLVVKLSDFPNQYGNNDNPAH
jgi:hypothetical protein